MPIHAWRAARRRPVHAELPLENFVDRTAWKRIDELERGDPLGLPQTRIGPFPEVFGFNDHPGVQRHEGDWRFFPLFRRHAHYCGFAHGLMPAKHGFEVARIDVEAAGNDHVLLAVHQHQEAVIVEATDVSGADEAMTCGIEPLVFARLRDAVVVASIIAGLRPTTSPASPRPTAWPASSTSRMSCPGTRLPDGVQLVRVQVCLEHAGPAAFGHPVVLVAGPRASGRAPPLQLGGEGRTGAELLAKAAEVEAIERRFVHQSAVLDRDQHRVGRAGVPRPVPGSARLSNRSISTTVPPSAIVGKKETSVVFEYSGVDSSVTQPGP